MVKPTAKAKPAKTEKPGKSAAKITAKHPAKKTPPKKAAKKTSAKKGKKR
jgi:hypothetical protein